MQLVYFTASDNWAKKREKNTISDATTPGKNGPGIDVNEGVLCIPQSSRITGASLSDCLMSYPGYSFGRKLPLCRDAKKKKRRKKGLTSIEMCVDATIQEFEEKNKERLITVTGKSNIIRNKFRSTQQKWEEKQLHGNLK